MQDEFKPVKALGLFGLGEQDLMRKVVLFSVAVAAIAGPAFAGDLPSIKETPVYLAPGPAFSWSGLYIGLQAGYAWATDYDNQVGVGKTKGAEHAFVGGGHAGYNLQVNSLVFGLEGDFEGTGLSKAYDPSVQNVFYPTGAQFNAHLFTQGSVRARAGFAFDRALVYATGGLALAEITTSYSFGGVTDTTSAVRTGWTVGGGVEYAFTNTISGRVEYRYTNFGPRGQNAPDFGAVFQNSYVEQAVRLGLTYHINAPSPVIVAKY
jgi:outer membrane immunogenic protein